MKLAECIEWCNCMSLPSISTFRVIYVMPELNEGDASYMHHRETTGVLTTCVFKLLDKKLDRIMQYMQAIACAYVSLLLEIKTT